MSRLLNLLNSYLDSYSWFDDDSGDTVIEGSEEHCYNIIMQDEEIHFLTSKLVKDVIHICFTDWKAFDSLCKQYHA